jgi:hypothetical protein
MRMPSRARLWRLEKWRWWTGDDGRGYVELWVVAPSARIACVG